MGRWEFIRRLGVFPAIKKIPLPEQRSFLTALMKHTHKLFTVVGIIVIMTGFLLGTVYGPMKSFNHMITTPYGQKFLTAFIIGIFTLVWGVVYGYRQTMKLLLDDFIREEALKGRKELLNKSFLQITLFEVVEVTGFLVLLYIMISF